MWGFLSAERWSHLTVRAGRRISDTASLLAAVLLSPSGPGCPLWALLLCHHLLCLTRRPVCRVMGQAVQVCESRVVSRVGHRASPALPPHRAHPRGRCLLLSLLRALCFGGGGRKKGKEINATNKKTNSLLVKHAS